ncbi:MAG: ComEA family DNA-binding protein [Candidatus Acidiferrales bacterium]
MAWRFLFRLSLVLAALCAIPLALAAKKKPPAAPINLNTATSAELQLVPGIGPATAEKILQMRKSYGPFKSVDDLRAIRGIGPKRLEKMRKYLVAGKSAPQRSARPRQPQPSQPKTAPSGSTSQRHPQHKPLPLSK